FRSCASVKSLRFVLRPPNAHTPLQGVAPPVVRLQFQPSELPTSNLQPPTSVPLFDNSSPPLIRGDPERPVFIRVPSSGFPFAKSPQGSTTRSVELRCLVADVKQGSATQECRGTLGFPNHEIPNRSGRLPELRPLTPVP